MPPKSKSGFNYGKGNLPRRGGKPGSGLTNQNQRRMLEDLMRPGTPPTRGPAKKKRGTRKPSTGSR
jgi:hypothetical protein